MMGSQALRLATQVAILSANYIAHKLKEHYAILYTGQNDMIAHECIIDIRPLKESIGIEVDDIAKRLVDFGFHAPTMSFPVPGTLMIEPTESESLKEIDRFCDAMIEIRNEISEVENGDYPWTIMFLNMPLIQPRKLLVINGSIHTQERKLFIHLSI